MTLELDPSCAAIFKGKVAINGACFYDEDCAADAYCSSDLKTCPSTCQPRLGVGAIASRGRECQAGLVLDVPRNGSSSTKCAQPVGANGDCLSSPAPCESGTTCRVASDAGVPSWRCARGQAAGDVCAPGSGLCAKGLVCRGTPEDGARCLAPYGRGQSCEPMLGGCQFDLECTSRAHGGLTCEVPPAAGAACASGVCGGGTRCVVGPDGGVCEPYAPQGSACAHSYECACSLFCSGPDGGTCVPRAGAGAPCPQPRGGGSGNPECLGTECGQGCRQALTCTASDAGSICARTQCDDPAL